jgi:hypothetical protein
MRILLDESLPRDLAREIPGHEITTVQNAGWVGLGNGELLRRAPERCDVLLTGDQSIEHQQNPARLDLAVVVMVAVSNRIEDLRPLIPELLQVLPRVQRGTFTRVGARKRSK